MIELFRFQEMFLRNVDGAHLASDRYDVFHAAAEDAHLASAGDGRFQDLCDAQHVAGEGRHDQTAVRLAHDVQDLLGHLLLGDGEILHAGVGGVAHQQIDADLPHVGHDLIVGVMPQRREVKLKVAGLHDASVGRVDQDAQRIRDGMDRVKKADGKMLHVDRGLVVDLNELDTLDHPVLLELSADQRAGKTRRVDRFDIDRAQQERNASDVIFVTMRDHEHLALAVVLDQMTVIRDYIIDTEQVVFWKTNTGIDDQDLVAMLKTISVFSDLTQSADRIDEGIVFFYGCFIIFISKTA